MDLSFNERRLIETVFREGAIARIDLARLSDMTGATITRIVGRLTEAGVFDESPSRTGSLGQPKRMLSLRVSSFCGAGVNFSLRRMDVALVSLNGEILGSTTLRTDLPAVDAMNALAMSAVDRLHEEAGGKAGRLVGIGCVVPGNFSAAGKPFELHPTYGSLLGESFTSFDGGKDAIVTFENDGSCAALGEYLLGDVARFASPVFFLHIGHGIGGGLIVDGKLFRGAKGNACLPGVLYPYDAPRPSGQDLLDWLANAGHAFPDLGDLPESPDEAPPAMFDWIDRAAGQLPLAIRTITGLFDPAAIVIGGRLPAWIASALVDRLNAMVIPGPSRGLGIAPIHASAFGPRAAAVGAAMVPLSAHFFPSDQTKLGNVYLNGRR